jgi:hypothetical protein
VRGTFVKDRRSKVMNKIKLVIIGSIACIAGVLADESRNVIDRYTGEYIRVSVDDDGTVKTYNYDTGEMSRGRANSYMLTPSGAMQRVDTDDDGSINNVGTLK